MWLLPQISGSEHANMPRMDINACMQCTGRYIQSKPPATCRLPQLDISKIVHRYRQRAIQLLSIAIREPESCISKSTSISPSSDFLGSGTNVLAHAWLRACLQTIARKCLQRLMGHAHSAGFRRDWMGDLSLQPTDSIGPPHGESDRAGQTAIASRDAFLIRSWSVASWPSTSRWPPLSPFAMAARRPSWRRALMQHCD